MRLRPIFLAFYLSLLAQLSAASEPLPQGLGHLGWGAAPTRDLMPDYSLFKKGESVQVYRPPAALLKMGPIQLESLVLSFFKGQFYGAVGYVPASQVRPFLSYLGAKYGAPQQPIPGRRFYWERPDESIGDTVMMIEYGGEERPSTFQVWNKKLMAEEAAASN